MRKFIIAILITVLNGILFLTSCDKKNDSPNDKDAVARITVVDEKGVPQGGLPVLIYDEEGYEKFRKDRNTEAKAFTVTLPNGQVNYRLPYSEWFTAGSRLVAFVIREELDAENYRIWAIRKNIKAAEQIRIDFRIDRTETPADPDVPAVPEEPTGTPIDMYDEENGRTTLFGDTLTLDAEHRLAGNNRYSFIDAGAVQGLDDMGELRLDKHAGTMAIRPGNGYFVCKDIALMEFPSGKWALAITSELARIYVSEWISKEERIVGARLRYTVGQPGTGELPEWGSIYEMKLSGDRSVTIPLPESSDDSECAPRGNTPVRFSYAKDHATAQITDPYMAEGKEYTFFIRSGSRYTEARIRILK